MGAGLEIAITILSALPQMITATQQVLDLIHTGTNTLKKMQLEGREPTAEEWRQINDLIDSQMAKLRG